jgi:hypothetical protein
MGDRNNIKVTYSNGGSVYLYSHWGGSGLREIVQNALDTSGRVNDESYFTRVLFCAMVAESDDLRGETGYGIAPYAPDQDVNNHMVHIDYTKADESTKWRPVVDYYHTEGQ